MQMQRCSITVDSNQTSSSNGRLKARVVPARYRLLGRMINLISRVNNEWAEDKLADMWFTVFKRRPRPWVHAFWSGADRCVDVHLSDKSVPVYLWGEGPLVILVHGWSGSGTQFRYFIPQLVAAGYRVAAFDAPAHGSHPGRYAHLLDFSDTLVGIQRELGEVDSVIAHSLGTLASVLATHRGLSARQMVMLAPHMNVKEMIDFYAGLLKLNAQLVAGFKEKVKHRIQTILGLEDVWELLNPAALFNGQNIQGLLMYDREDAVVPLSVFNEIDSLWQPQHTLQTSGLGHYLLFKDNVLIGQVVEYIKGCQSKDPVKNKMPPGYRTESSQTGTI